MSFFSNIKRGLGFGHEDDELLSDDDEIRLQTSDHDRKTDNWHPSGENTPGELFDAIITLFNKWSPEFVRECIDTESQRRYIYESLSAELRARIGKSESHHDYTTDTTNVATVASIHTDGNSTPRHDEIESLRAENARLAGIRQQLEEARLSADRQKRALTDRIHDLTNRITMLEEKNERLILSAAHTSTKNVTKPETDEETSKTIAQLNDRISLMKTEIDDLTTKNAQLTTKARMSDSMLSELSGKLSQAKKENDEMAEELKHAEEVAEQIEKIEQLIARKDAKISDLTKQLEQSNSLKEKIDDLQNEKNQLRKTIETNLYNQAHSENRLRNEIKHLRGELETLRGDAPAKETPRRRRKQKFDSATDSTPPEPDGDFGYKAPPVRQRQRDDDAQMSLF